MKIAVIANSAWYLANFRLELMRRLRAIGHDVVAISAEDRHASRLTAEGFRHLAWHLDASSRRPLGELQAIAALRRLLANEAIDVAFTFTPKANIYSGLVLRSGRTAFVPNVSGLGFAFVQRTALAALVKFLYRLAFARAKRVFFQNDVDRLLFVRARLVDEELTQRLPGSGVDLRRFTPRSLPLGPRRVLLFVGRMLADKGVRDLVEASRRVKARRDDLCVRLLGPADARNPTAVSPAELRGWADAGLVEYLGETDDVRPAIAAADGVVLPSVYREGVPRSLLEAAAMGRPAITYDMPGCRDAIDHGRTGWVCPPRDIDALVHAITGFLDLPALQLRVMGQAARAKMELEFSEERVLEAYVRVLP